MKHARQSDSSLKQLVDKHMASVEVCSTREIESAGASDLLFENRMALSVAEVAVALGLSTRTIERLVKRGELRVRRVGRRVLIPREELGAWLNRKE